MSNVVVGEIYRQIMEKILAAAQNDFEEGGYAPETLHDLKALWQENLSKLHVAQMPWDPKPAPPPIKHESAGSPIQNGNGVDKQDVKFEGSSQPEIKTEPQTNASYNSMQGYAGGGVNPMAQQRAADHLLQRFGPQANASIQAAGLVQQPRPQAGNSPSTTTSQAEQIDVKPALAAAQTDGVGDAAEDWNDVVEATRCFEAQRATADGFFRSQMDSQDAIANAGLLLNTPENRAALRKLSRQQERLAARHAARAARRSIPQVDGDEDDDEAINSELDDSQDEMEEQEDDDDGPLGEMILCTWDKVNRVKNKWKCTLKDGVLATHGKEYLFSKATGEFEW